MKNLIFGVFSIGMGLLFCSFDNIASIDPNNDSNAAHSADNRIEYNLSVEERLFEQISSIKELVNSKSDYNNEIAFLIDMRIMSGKNRFFVYDLKNDRIIDQGLVAHGVGSGSGVYGDLRFSNENGSYCTSLGKYYVGKSYNGEYGKAYKLYGFEETNSNAFSRNIVLHKYERVPYAEQDQTICFSMGCPMVNETFYKRIEQLIDSSKGKIILDIYY